MRVEREAKRAGEGTFGDRQCAKGHIRFIGDPAVSARLRRRKRPLPHRRSTPSLHKCLRKCTVFAGLLDITTNIARARIRTLRVPRAPRLVDVGRIPCPVVDRRRACPEHEAAVRAWVATRAAVARGEERYRLRTPTSRSAPGLSGRLAIPMPAVRTRLPGSRVHRGHLATAGCDGVRVVCHGAAAVNLLPRARRRGADAVVGEQPRLAPGPWCEAETQTSSAIRPLTPACVKPVHPGAPGERAANPTDSALFGATSASVLLSSGHGVEVLRVRVIGAQAGWLCSG
jgi:hypothetical protein